MDRLLEAVSEGLRHPGLQEKLDWLETRRKEIKSVLAANPSPAPRLHPDLAELYRRKVEELRDAIEDDETRDEALEILRGFIDRVTIKPLDHGFEIEIVGDLAKMIAAPKSGASEPIENESSVKVVAGARYQRYLQLARGWIPHIAIQR